MSVVITGSYTGNKRVRLRHDPSGAEISTSAPKDNQGDGLLFSPTDLVAAALGSCILTTIAIVAERKGIDVSAMQVRVEKHMSTDPRRIGGLPTAIHLPAALAESERSVLERAALSCPVHRSLHPEVEAPVTFHYDL